MNTLIIFIMTLLLAPPTTSPATRPATQPSNIPRIMAELRRQVADLTKRVADLDAQVKLLQEENASLKRQIDSKAQPVELAARIAKAISEGCLCKGMTVDDAIKAMGREPTKRTLDSGSVVTERLYWWTKIRGHTWSATFENGTLVYCGRD